MERNRTIDITKAVGIILMVIGHSGFVYTRWIYQFHMAVFFVIAGFCYSERHSKDFASLKGLVISRIKSLYVPCVLFNSAVVLLHNPLNMLHITGGGGGTV